MSSHYQAAEGKPIVGLTLISNSSYPQLGPKKGCGVGYDTAVCKNKHTQTMLEYDLSASSLEVRRR